MRLRPGSHMIALSVSDDRGHTAGASVNITVRRSMDYPPIVTVSFPAEGAVLQGRVVVNGTAWDDAEVLGVYVRIDDGAWDPASGTELWSYQWDTTKVANGTHRISVKASDRVQSSIEVSVNVTVANPPAPPPPGQDGGGGEGTSLQLAVAAAAIVALAAGAGAALLYMRRRRAG